MAVSSKYFNFNKNPFSGLRGNPYASGPTYNSFQKSSSCFMLEDAGLAYTAPDVVYLQVGVTIYTDTTLLTPAAGAAFYLNDVIANNPAYFTTNGSGVINSMTQCTFEWIGLDQCGGAATTLYTKFNASSLIAGVTLYTTEDLGTTYTGSNFSFNFSLYIIADGVITSVRECLTQYNSYDACGGNLLTLYGTTLDNGNKMYLDANGDTQFSGSQFAYSGVLYTYDNTGINGITGSSACPT